MIFDYVVYINRIFGYDAVIDGDSMTATFYHGDVMLYTVELI